MPHIQIKPQFASSYEKRIASKIQAGIENGFMKIEAERHLPLVIADYISGDLPQYYGQYILVDDKCLSDIRYCSISVGQRYLDGKTWGVNVAVHDGAEDQQGAYTYSRPILEEDYTGEPTDQAIQAAIEKARQALAGDDLRPAFQEQAAREAAAAALLEGVPEHPSREEYERTCEALGFEPKSDADLIWFAERYSHDAGQYHCQDAKERARINLWHRRGWQAKAERPAPTLIGFAQARPAVPEKTGQLWEPCEHCGREPIYMPLHVCEHCWPR